MEPWWERHPEALDAEEKGLDAWGCEWVRNDDAWHAGHLVINVALPHDGKVLNLTAHYPATYPYFPPQVSLKELLFPRHQHLVGKNLCLLAREGAEWRPGHDTLAILLRDQLPTVQGVHDSGNDSAFTADNEDHVGEPFSSFLPYQQNCAVIVPDETPPPEHPAGRLTLQVRPAPVNVATPPFFSGIVRTISDLNRKPLIEFPVTLPAFSQPLTGFWLRLTERPSVSVDFGLHFYNLILDAVPAFRKAINTGKRGQLYVGGFVYPDEVRWRASADDWFFLAIKIQQEAKGAREARVQINLIRADWGGEHVWMQRAPSLRPLRAKSALVIGLGSLGSPLVLHLARAGIGKLHLIDYDELQVGNTVRWALGWQYAGLHKASALAMHLAHEYPYTAVDALNMRIGAPSPAAGDTDYEILRTRYNDVDLIIDATANHRVSHFLADLARRLRKPYLWLTTTHGAAGGVVGRVLPEKAGGCWHCFQHGLGDLSIRTPADSGAAEVQPGGCSQPTFIGAGIDSEEIALLAARLAVATLSIAQPGGYPDFAWDIAVADLNQAGQSIAPEWTPYPLKVNSACAACNPR